MEYQVIKSILREKGPPPTNEKIRNQFKEKGENNQGYRIKNFQILRSIKVNYKTINKKIDGKTIGNGIQQIPSYKCPIPYDKLNELREEFWKSRTQHKGVWKVIRECCTTDSETAVLLLEAAEMACLDGSLRKVFLLSNPDYIFNVPNFCVCDPSFERDYEELEKKAANIPESNIQIVCYYLAKNKNITLDVTNKTKIIDVKKAFAKQIGIKYDKYNIRFLFKGQELVNDHLLCYHNVENMSKIQVMVCKKEKEKEKE